jgi:acetyl-CoA carboxylase biotin carboxyl carrier protein
LELKDIKEIKAIIDLMKKNDLSVFEIERDGFRLKLQKGPTVQTVATAPSGVTPSQKGTMSSGETTGAAPKPIESVPLREMNEIKAETSGVIAEVVAENGKPVQFGQVLFRVR